LITSDTSAWLARQTRRRRLSRFVVGRPSGRSQALQGGTMPSQTSNRVLKHPRGQNRSNALEKSGDNEAQMDELGNDPGQVGSDSAGQSVDTQGLSQTADAAGESVEELADTDQAYEAEAISGIEDAADHPEEPVRISENYAPANRPSS
jgi:hypothetical protein